MNRRSILRLVTTSAAAGALPAPATSGRKPRLRTAICAYSYRKELESGRLKYEDLVRLAVDFEVDGLDLTVYWFPGT